MKKNIRFIVLTVFMIAGTFIAQVSFSQPALPPAPPTSGSNGGSNSPMGGAAPIDGGLVILLAAGMGYGAKKVYQTRFSKKENA
jgi:hypothetical protein